jgi:hypothetical protein
MEHTAPIDVEREIEMERKKAEYMKYENKVNVCLPPFMMKEPVCLRRHIYMSHVNKVQPIRVKMKCIAAIRVTCICVAQDI